MRINMANHCVPHWITALSITLILSSSFTTVVADVNYTFNQLGLDIDGEATGDSSGQSVALSRNGKIVAIGAQGNDGVNGTDSGHARVYKFNGGSWSQMGQDLDGEFFGDYFGYDVDLSKSGKIVAVGALANDGGATDGGHVRVFEYNGSGNKWEQLGSDLDGDINSTNFGGTLALSGDGYTLAAAGIDYIQVYRYDGTSWNTLGQELAYGPGQISKTLISLSSDGSVLAFGEPFDPSGVHVFEYQDGTELWSQMGETVTGGENLQFGVAVSLSQDGTILGVGATGNSSVPGSASVFQYNGTAWIPLGNTIYASGIFTLFGLDLELSEDGQRIVVGAFLDGIFLQGKMFLYEYDGVGSWCQVGNDIEGEGIVDFSGWSVSVSGNGRVIASGAVLNLNTNGVSGHVRVYEAKRLTPGASGDPHFKTWTGESYDFHGLCDLVLLKNQDFKSGLGMDIYIRTKKMKQWSFISNAVLRIGEDTLEIMGSATGNAIGYWINGVTGNKEALANDALLPHSISGYPIFYKMMSTKQHEFTVELGNDEKIVMKTWKDLVRVDIHGATATNFGESVGLMGSFNEGLHLGRDKTTEFADINDFGQEWQVLPNEPSLFHSREGPQAPEKCAAPSSTKLRRRLTQNSVSQEQAIIACAVVDAADRDMCIFDVMATNDIDIKGAY